MGNLGVRAALVRATTNSTELGPSACLTEACKVLAWCVSIGLCRTSFMHLSPRVHFKSESPSRWSTNLLSKRQHIAFLSCFDLLAVSCEEALSASGPSVVEREKSLESWRHAISEEDVVDREKDHDIVRKECKSRPRIRTPSSRASVQECTRLRERDEGAAMEPVPNVSVHNENC